MVESLSRGPEILDWIKDREDNNECLDPLKEDFFDYENELNAEEGLYGTIADVMNKETGISFEYRVAQDADYCSDDTILFPQMYPWNLNELEVSLTTDKLDEIFTKYIDELCDVIKPEPQYIRLE